MTVLISYDLPGLDLASNTLSNHTQCCAFCLATPGCVGFTWGLPSAGGSAYICYLKSGYPSPNYNVNFNSARY